ncbi:MAG TPA: cupin domain-containing protein [Noviherbaspirillum sp.]|uniref:cupin domain-containing protein n=1 Tax=Noviherbaspirillum sp. TaxID=1926288 RepID=UPI002F927130
MTDTTETPDDKHTRPTNRPRAIVARDAAPRLKPSNYPEPFASRMAGREKRPLGDLFGLSNFGVNLTRLPPHAVSALRHAHSRQDEFVYILSGEPVLVTDEGELQLQAGMCAGFAAGADDAHHLINRSGEDVWYIEVGDRRPGDQVRYPDDDLDAVLDADGRWRFLHKDGQAY